jgi:hypothetical protein
MGILIVALVFALLAAGVFAIKASQNAWDLLHVGLSLLAGSVAGIIVDALHLRGAF